MILILLIFMGIGFYVQYKLKAKFEAYSKVPSTGGMSGREVAEKMLSDFGIYSVVVQSVPGKLTDHYNPTDKTINLSPEVYNGRSVASAAIAAHECGHAVQHATAYKWLGFRTMMVPIVSLSGKIMNFLFIAMLLGAFAFQMFPLDVVLMTLIVAQAAIATFTLITLPVEYDASNRALAWLRTTGTTNPEEHAMASNALKWAARTYVVAALAAITQLFYYITLFLGSRD